MAILWVGAAGARDVIQTDWSLGGGTPGPVSEWGAAFDGATEISWLAVADQVTLSQVPLSAPRAHLINDAFMGSFGMDAGDIDGDGDTDLVGAADASGVVLLWRNDGNNPVTFTEEIIDAALPGASAVFIADVDGDGRQDIVGSGHQSSYTLLWWRNDGFWTRQTIATGWAGAYEVYVADVDRDGHLDVLSAAYTAQEIAWWRNDGQEPITWTKHSIATSFAGAHSVWSADFDDDGDTDLVGCGALDNEIAWWRNDGGWPINWVKTTLSTSFTGARSVKAADLDGDGREDIVGICWSNHVKWWRNLGGDPLTFDEQMIDSYVYGGHFVDVADINGDGRCDVLAAACLSHDVLWWSNDGGSWTRHFVDGDVTNAIQAHAGDFDGDGDLDVMATSYYLGTFTWWEVTEFVSSGTLESSILDAEAMPQGVSCEWDADLPADGAIYLQVRSSNDPDDLGDWSPEMREPGPLGDLERYIQYRARLETTDPDEAPILHEIRLNWASSSVGPYDKDESLIHWEGANPLCERASLALIVAQAQHMRVTLHDTGGRRVALLHEGPLVAGKHEFTIRGLGPGLYFLRTSERERNHSQRIVILP